jgi:multidrug efflux pump subunit AcrA (membrane-fusion protein)
VGSLVALAVVALVASAALARTSSGPTYRTATVVRATVAEQLRASGTIEPVAEASVSFPTSGTVASVAVNVGDAVRTGQVLATLDATGLQATLDQRNATLAQAKVTLANAEAGQSSTRASTGSGSGSGAAGSATPSGSAASTTTTTAARSAQGSGSGASGSATTSAAALAAAQQAVIQDQQQLDRDLALARADLAAAQAACVGTAASTATGSTTTSTTAATGVTSAACLNAQRQLLIDQTAVSNLETSLAQAEQALDALLSSGASGSSDSSSATAASAADTSSSTNAASSSNAATAPSAQELVADQAAVDAAAAEVAVAQQGLDQASIVSPINGTVAAVELAVGDSVTADSSTQAVVVAGPGGYEVATTVSVSHRAELELGDAATVVADGSTRVLAAKVVAIGVAGTTSGSTTTYPVVVGFSTSPDGLRDGASASVTIELASVVAATAVPTSAVHTSGTTHTVTVLDGSTTKSVKVTTGVVGAQLTQIKTGLRVGQVVVLADLSQALPSSDSTGTSRRSGLGGGGLTTSSSGFSGGFGGTGGPPTGPGGG